MVFEEGVVCGFEEGEVGVDDGKGVVEVGRDGGFDVLDVDGGFVVGGMVVEGF